MSQTPHLAEVIEAGVDERLEKFVTAIPATVTHWNSLANTVDIELSVVNATEDSSGGITYLVPRVNGVSILYPGSGKNRMTFPIAQGDQVLYIVSSLPIDGLMSTGKAQLIHVPSISRNNVAYGFAIPGLYTYRNNDNTPSSETDVVLSAEHSIKLGAGVGTSPVALESTLTKFVEILGTVADTAGACAALKLKLEEVGWPDDFMATKVQAK